VKIYRYQEGNIMCVGTGHSSEILKTRISPDQKHIVSVSADGAIFRWKFPWDNLDKPRQSAADSSPQDVPAA
jgi:WD40 repeat protein